MVMGYFGRGMLKCGPLGLQEEDGWSEVSSQLGEFRALLLLCGVTP